MLDNLKKFVYWAVSLAIIMLAAIGWSFFSYGGLIPGPYNVFVNFIGWVIIGVKGMDLAVYVGRRLGTWP